MTIRRDHVEHSVPAVKLSRDGLQEGHAPIAMKRCAQDAVRGFISERAKATACPPRARLRCVHFGHEVGNVPAYKRLE